ncbi:unnamed protein product [marine sediment metagenome]|uniref:Uncharacterized protein n=1 Tax=marine sediment metagenome TaxID=412755 RepID=X1TU33_9ZZZZ
MFFIIIPYWHTPRLLTPRRIKDEDCLIAKMTLNSLEYEYGDSDEE